MINLLTTRTTYSMSGVPLFYYSVKNFSPAGILNIVDVGKYIPENNPSFNLYERIEPKTTNSREYILPKRFRTLVSGALLVTDRSTVSKFVDYTIPLFYEYQLMYNHYASDSLFPKGF